MHLVCAAQIGWNLKMNIPLMGLSIKGSTEQDALSFSLMTVVEKTLDGRSFKRQSETVMPLSKAALSTSI